MVHCRSFDGLRPLVQSQRATDTGAVRGRMMKSGFLWPNGAKVAVSLTFDVDAEAGVLGEGTQYAKRLTSLSEGRFGVTRGLPRILNLLRLYGIPATFFVPGYTAETHPDAISAIVEHGHELAHHGYLHLRPDTAPEDVQREEFERGIDALKAIEPGGPVGYRSPAWELTPETLALLLERGFEYDSSCMGDDRPYVETHAGQSILELPVHWSLDDFPRFGWSIDGGGNVTTADELFTSWSAEYRCAREENRHVVYTMHPEIIGRAYRLRQLEALVRVMVQDGGVWFARLDEVARHVAADVRSPV